MDNESNEKAFGHVAILSDAAHGYRFVPDLLTESELIEYLRIPQVSTAGNYANVVENLKRFHGLPCIHISKQPLYPLEAIRHWVQEKTAKERWSRY